MYKVFYNNRTIFLTDEYKTNFSNNRGLFVNYNNLKEFEKFWNVYESTNHINNLFVFNKDIDELKDGFFSLFTLVDAAGGLVFNANNQVLIIKRFGKWDLPKGKVEKDEKIEEAAIREVEEECGISNVKSNRLINSTYHTYYLNNEKILKKTHWYSMKYEGNEAFMPQAEEDITEVRWVDVDKLDFIKANTYKSIIDVMMTAGLMNSKDSVSA